MNYDWLESAACRRKAANVFFAEDNEKNFDPRPAKATCAMCPVRAECLAAGMRESDGIWGGLTQNERKRLKRGGQPKRCPVCKWLTVSYVNGTTPPCCKRCEDRQPEVDEHVAHLRKGEAYEPRCATCRERTARYKRAWRSRAS